MKGHGTRPRFQSIDWLQRQEVQDLIQSAEPKCCCGQELAKKRIVRDIRKDDDPNVKNGHMLGTFAAKSGCFSCVCHLMCQGNNPNDSKNANGSTMLHYASLNGRPKIVLLLVNAGANVNLANKRCRTALHEAATTGHWKVVEVLLEHGADVMSKNKYGRTTLHVATKYDNAEVIDLLVRHRKKQLFTNITPVIGAYPKKYKLVKSLIWLIVEFTCGVANQKDVCFCAQDVEDNDIKQDFEIPDNEHGHTIATKAAVSGCVKCCKWLLQCGLDINQPTTNDGSSMLYCAVYKIRTSCVQLLCENGANVNLVNTRGRLPLRTAIKTGNPEIVKTLCEHKADLNQIMQLALHPRVVDIVHFYRDTNRLMEEIQRFAHEFESDFLKSNDIDRMCATFRSHVNTIIHHHFHITTLNPDTDLTRVWKFVEQTLAGLRALWTRAQALEARANEQSFNFDTFSQQPEQMDTQ